MLRLFYLNVPTFGMLCKNMIFQYLTQKSCLVLQKQYFDQMIFLNMPEYSFLEFGQQKLMCLNLQPTLMWQQIIVWILQKMKPNSFLSRASGHKCKYKYLGNNRASCSKQSKQLPGLQASLRWMESCNQKGRYYTSTMTEMTISSKIPVILHT